MPGDHHHYWTGSEWLTANKQQVPESGNTRLFSVPTTGGWRVELGDPSYPIRYWNGTDTRFTLDNAGELTATFAADTYITLASEPGELSVGFHWPGDDFAGGVYQTAGGLIGLRPPHATGESYPRITLEVGPDDANTSLHAFAGFTQFEGPQSGSLLQLKDDISSGLLADAEASLLSGKVHLRSDDTGGLTPQTVELSNNDGTVLIKNQADGGTSLLDEGTGGILIHGLRVTLQNGATDAIVQASDTDGVYLASPGGVGVQIAGAAGSGAVGSLGFYGATPTAQQTGVAVSTAAVHAALVTLGLITA